MSTIRVEAGQSVLSETILDACGANAAVYDRENRFFDEDFALLRDAGYLRMAVPAELGGLGFNLAQVCAEQRRLASRAAPTALALTMHLSQTGVAADLWRAGDTSQGWLLQEAAEGAVFAYGNAEPGNDLPLLYSSARAERVDGGYRIYGRKSFGSLSPVWTRLCVHAADDSDPAHPKIVHAYVERGTPGVETVETWDTLGMRATQSHDTVLDGAFAPDATVARVVAAGLAGADAFILGIFAWEEISFAAIYLGLAERAFVLAIDQVKSKSSIPLGGRSMAYHPFMQYEVAEMAMELEAMAPHVERMAADWTNGVDHGGLWASKLVAVKHRATQGAQRVVDLALEVSGGTGMFKRNELERLYRDVRCGPFHPANSSVTHEVVGKTYLGVLGEEPRW
ncbi:MAG: acyl-CoA dehydrogenase family protein [Acidimicrobiales bacterium]